MTESGNERAVPGVSVPGRDSPESEASARGRGHDIVPRRATSTLRSPTETPVRLSDGLPGMILQFASARMIAELFLDLRKAPILPGQD